MTDDAQAVLDQNILGHLATVNEDGSPWSTPLHLVSDGEALYWFSKADKVHSQNLVRDPRASVSIFSPDESRGPSGVYVSGRVEVLDGEGHQHAYELFQQRLGTMPPAFDGATAYRLPIGTFSEEKSTGKCWYFYS